MFIFPLFPHPRRALFIQRSCFWESRFSSSVILAYRRVQKSMLACFFRSRTQGRGQYTMEPSHYVELPKSLQEKLVSKHGGKDD